MRTLTARYSGFCQKCRRNFPAGTEINWDASAGSEHKGVCPPCADCAALKGHEDTCPQNQNRPKATFHRQPYFAQKRQVAQALPNWKQETYPVETEYDLTEIELGGRGTSYFAVPYDGDGAFDQHWFARIDKPKDGKYAGQVFVKWVYGEVERGIGRQFTGEMFRFKKGEERFDYPLNELYADPEVAKARYGKLIGRCGNCHKRLTDATSRQIGIGPECRRMLKYWQGKVA